ncbi:MAG: helix-turn-helix transcriptional regulator [Flavobacteriales bacterium]|nr:helix-turn-helix transcriptional regulator [Flavobacteriales bacterium]
METTTLETPLARLIRQRGLKKGFVAEYMGIWPSRLSLILKGSSYMTLAEGLKAAELFGVEVRELLP